MGWNVIVDDDGQMVATLCGRDGVVDRNAALIAAAPEMLAQLQNVNDIWGRHRTRWRYEGDGASFCRRKVRHTHGHRQGLLVMKLLIHARRMLALSAKCRARKSLVVSGRARAVAWQIVNRAMMEVSHGI